MNRDETRAKIRERLKTGALPRYLPIPSQPLGGKVPGTSMSFGPSSNVVCSACDLMGADIRHQYPDRVVAFHADCAAIWNEERQGPIRD